MPSDDEPLAYYEIPADETNNSNRQVIEEFRANHGKVGGFFEDKPLVLVHSVGAKSGIPRINPLYLFEDDGRRFVPGSFGGSPKHPAWVHNLRANPNVTVEVGTETYPAVAVELGREERDPLYQKLSEQADIFAEAQANTTRIIPLFELVRTPS
ncbi:nitroreductase/quinone reductase family protein [Mycobacteriaceae bacterium NPDC060252]